LRCFPYCTEDLSAASRLVDAGCKAVMPWAAPIGSAKGIINRDALKLLRDRLSDITLVVDAGIGAPSHASEALEDYMNFPISQRGKEYLETARTLPRAAKTMTDQAVASQLRALADDYQRRAEKASHVDAAKAFARSTATTGRE
jgi:thiazole synthase ThiGH ThiG subunit